MANYTREKSKYGGMVGTIQIFASQLPQVNSPDNSTFKSLLPAGFLRCDGSILDATRYPDLAQILGTGVSSKFKKETIELTNEQFQLPDLGSKYMVAGTGNGLYADMFLLDGETYHVGAEFNVTANTSATETINYSGRFVVPGKSELLQGSPLYRSNNKTEDAFLSDLNFQAHGHLGNQSVLNYTGNYVVTTGLGPQSSSKSHSGDRCRCLGGNTYERSTDAGTEDNIHGHDITMPTPGGHIHNFTWTYNTFNAPVDGLETTVNIVRGKTNTTFDDTQAPFILVEYVIKY